MKHFFDFLLLRKLKWAKKNSRDEDASREFFVRSGMFFAFRLVAVKRVQDVDELSAIFLRRRLGEDFVGAVQKESRKVDVRLFSGIGTVMLQQEVEGNMKVVRYFFQRLMVRLADAALVAVVCGLADMKRMSDVRLSHRFFFAKIAQTIALHEKSPSQAVSKNPALYFTKELRQRTTFYSETGFLLGIY